MNKDKLFNESNNEINWLNIIVRNKLKKDNKPADNK